MSTRYFTLIKEGEGKYTEKMSKFLSFACQVYSAEEAKERIKSFQNKYHDARHVCWAYMLGPQRLEWQLNDNGEPSGTAGKPILGQINSFGLTDTLIVVVRYFGGIKLGTSGLISAYREAARLAIEAAGVQEMKVMARLKLGLPYEEADKVMRIIKKENLQIAESVFDSRCEITLDIPEEEADGYRKRFENYLCEDF